VIVGSVSVGKTCLLTRYLSDEYNPDEGTTLGGFFFPKELDVEGVHLKLNIWDTAGQERYRAMAPLYYKQSDAAMVVYDITRPQSFDAVRGWIDELHGKIDRDKLVLCICGNKNDLERDRKVPAADGAALADVYGATFFETSALTADGVDKAFAEMVKGIVQKRARHEASEGDPSILLGVAENDATHTSGSDTRRCAVCGAR